MLIDASQKGTMVEMTVSGSAADKLVVSEKCKSA